jgi:hypothetical protein
VVHNVVYNYLLGGQVGTGPAQVREDHSADDLFYCGVCDYAQSRLGLPSQR